MAHHHHHHDTSSVLGQHRIFALTVGLNLFFVLIEFGCGLAADSLALIADAGHNLSDVLGLLLAWGAVWLAGRRPTRLRTYGMRRATIYASLLSAVLLFIGLAVIVWEALQRIAAPTAVNAEFMIAVAAIGVVINGLSVKLLASGDGHKHDLNLRGAYLHMLMDAGVSAAVVVAGVFIILSDWSWLDPVLSLLIVMVILRSAWRLFSEAAHLALDGVPANIDPEQVQNYLCGLPAVQGCHDLHIWAMSTTESVLTAHLHVLPMQDQDDFLHHTACELRRRFGIHHVTLQLEHQHLAQTCPQAHPHSV